jgi:hypothetical protein
VSEAVAASKPYQLGGSEGVTRGWGQAMGCEVSKGCWWGRAA